MPSNILINDYNVENIFLNNNFFKTVSVANASGSTLTLSAGRVMGQILATGGWYPNNSAATNGSEMPRAILVNDVSIADGESADVTVCIRGEVNKNKVTLQAGDDWSTAVRTVSTGGGTIESLLIQNSELILVESTQLSGYDNS